MKREQLIGAMTHRRRRNTTLAHDGEASEALLPSPNMVVRQARPEEYDAIGALLEDVYVGGGFTQADSPYRQVLRDVVGRAARGRVLVAVDEAGRVVGSVTYCEYGVSDAHIAQPGEAEFRMLAVAPSARRRGVGAALVRACMELARTVDGRMLRLSTEPAMSDAQRLYEALGFVRTPERDWSPWPDGWLLTYALEV